MAGAPSAVYIEKGKSSQQLAFPGNLPLPLKIYSWNGKKARANLTEYRIKWEQKKYFFINKKEMQLLLLDRDLATVGSDRETARWQMLM